VKSIGQRNRGKKYLASTRSAPPASRLVSFHHRLLVRRGLRNVRILPLTADLEGAEVLVPGAVRSFRLRLPPELELVQVLGADLPLTETLEQVLP